MIHGLHSARSAVFVAARRVLAVFTVPAVPAVPAIVLIGVLMAFGSQPAQSQPPERAGAEHAAAAARQPIGDATRNLLALQREGHSASATPRPIAGDVAQLSYQRYLDSFDGARHPIAAQFGTAVKAGSGTGSGR